MPLASEKRRNAVKREIFREGRADASIESSYAKI